MNLIELKNKQVTVFGMGKSGIAALELLVQMKANVFAVNQGSPADWNDFDRISDLIPTDKCVSQEHSEDTFAKSDLIVISPGIPNDHAVLTKAIAAGVEIVSEIELAFHFMSEPIIAITGTNGKTTTTTILSEILKKDGKNFFVGGNIGTPACQAYGKEYDGYLLELSSFQLEKIDRFRPNLAAILNISMNHGERYQRIEDYASAKIRISKNMKKEDTLFVSEDLLSLVNKTRPLCELETVNDDSIKSVLSGFDLKKFKLPGCHNLENLCFAVKFAKKLGVSDKSIQKVIDEFKGVPHRIEFVKETAKGNLFFNDAKSTNMDATLTAVDSFNERDEKLVLILGGQKRGVGDSWIEHRLQLKHKVDKILLVGETTDIYFDQLSPEIDVEKSYNLENAFEKLQNVSNAIVLYSPGQPSFDQFKNYVARGEFFKKLVMGIIG